MADCVCRHAPGIRRDKFESFHKIKGPKVSREGTTDKGGREEDFGVAVEEGRRGESGESIFSTLSLSLLLWRTLSNDEIGCKKMK